MSSSSETDADSPEVTLLAFMPCKRLEIGPQCTNGRGGVVLSGAGANRFLPSVRDAGLRFAVSVAVRPTVEGDEVQSVRLTARTGKRTVGVQEYDWTDFDGRCGTVHRYRDRHEPLTIYEWAESLPLALKYEGLVSVEVELKLKSRPDFLSAVGRGQCHFSEQSAAETSPYNAEMPAWRYWLTRPFLSATAGERNLMYRVARRLRDLHGSARSRR